MEKIESLTWNDGMSVGIDAIDNDHKKIISIINKLIRASHHSLTDDFLNDVFGELEHYVQTHFNREEALMASIDYKQLEAHKRTHAQFVQKIPELKAQLLTNNSYDVAEDINLFLHDWIINHILTTDMDYAASYYHYCSKIEKGAPKGSFQKISHWLVQHLTLTQRIFISAVIPIIGLFILSFIILKDNYQQYTNVLLLSEINPIITQINSVTHTLQIERGLSTGLISSNHQQFLEELKKRRQVTDKSITAFFIQLEQQSSKLFSQSSSLMEPQLKLASKNISFFNIKQLKGDLALLKRQRKQIDEKQGSVLQLKSSYTRFISHLLDIQNRLTHINMSSTLANHIMAISALLNFKENLGQQRALGTAILEQTHLAKNRNSQQSVLQAYKQFNMLGGKNELLLQSFFHFSNETQKTILASFSTRELTNDFSHQVAAYIESDITLSYNAEQWFQVISGKINELKIINDQLINQLEQRTTEQLDFFLNRYYSVLFIVLLIIASSAIVLFFLNYSIINPIHKITLALQGITSGDKSQQFYEHFAHDEIYSIYKAYEQLRRKLLQSDISDGIIRQQTESIELRKDKNKLYKKMALTDALTGAINRRSFDDIIQSEIAHSQVGNLKLSVMMLDIDHFKAVNDNYGHASGDLVLKKFYQVCHDAVRSSDLIARIGGEEFVIIMPKTGLKQAKIFAERLRKKVADTQILINDTEHLSITVSIGVAQWDCFLFENDADFLKQIDGLLYQAKHSGRNCIVSMDTKVKY